MQSLETVLCSSRIAKFRELVYRWVKWARYKFPAQSQYIFTWHQYASSLTQMSVSSSSRIKGKVNCMVRYDPYMNCFYNAELLSTILKLKTCGGGGRSRFDEFQCLALGFFQELYSIFWSFVTSSNWEHCIELVQDGSQRKKKKKKKKKMPLTCGWDGSCPLEWKTAVHCLQSQCICQKITTGLWWQQLQQKYLTKYIRNLTYTPINQIQSWQVLLL